MNPNATPTRQRPGRRSSDRLRLAAPPQPFADIGLSEAEAAARRAARGRVRERRTSRSYASIVRANVFTVFNLILAVAGAAMLVFGEWQDALFLGVLVANATIGTTQEVRAKRALDRLSCACCAASDSDPRRASACRSAAGARRR